MAYDVAIWARAMSACPSDHLRGAGCRVLLVDVVADVVDALNRGESHIEDVGGEPLVLLVEQGLIRATTDYADEGSDAILIAAHAALALSAAATFRSSRRRGASPRFVREGQIVVSSRRTWGVMCEVCSRSSKRYPA